MTLAKARANASTKAKHIYNTDVNYDHHLQSSKYFYRRGIIQVDHHLTIAIYL
jgi:hypothetical protein